MFIVVKGNKKPRHRRGNGLYSCTERETALSLVYFGSVRGSITKPQRFC